MLQPNERMFLHLLDYLFDSISVALQYVLRVAFSSSAVAGHYLRYCFAVCVAFSSSAVADHYLLQQLLNFHFVANHSAAFLSHNQQLCHYGYHFQANQTL